MKEDYLDLSQFVAPPRQGKAVAIRALLPRLGAQEFQGKHIIGAVKKLPEFKELATMPNMPENVRDELSRMHKEGLLEVVGTTDTRAKIYRVAANATV